MQGEGILADKFSLQATADEAMAVVNCARDLYRTNITTPTATTTTATPPALSSIATLQEQPGSHRSLLRLWRLRAHTRRPRRQWR
jgi:hypothetical protein